MSPAPVLSLIQGGAGAAPPPAPAAPAAGKAAPGPESCAPGESCAVPGTRTIPLAGATVLWSCEESPLAAVQAAFAAAGFAPPTARTASQALKAALHTVYPASAGCYLRPGIAATVTGTVEVLSVLQDGTDASGTKRRGIELDAARVLADGSVQGTADVQRAYNAATLCVDATDIGQAIRAAVVSLHGVPLRERGSVFWLPAPAIPKLAVLAAALAEHAPKCQVCILRVAAVGPDGKPDAAGLQGLVRELSRELSAQAAGILDEILGGAPGPDGKPRAPVKRRDGLKNRQAALAKIKTACEQAESTLGEALPAVRATLQTAETAATAALLAALGV